MAKKLLSIIVPAYNEQEVLPLFYERLCNCIKPLEDNYDIEIIFTNNASIDKTPDLVSQWHKDDPRVNLITLSRNFGYFSSILSGLTHANGDLFIIIDCDGEDPPELICDFIKEHECGKWDVVYGRRSQRPEPFLVQFGRKIFYRFTRMIADNDFVLDMAEFLLMTRRVRDEVLNLANSFPFIRNDVAYIGFRRTGIDYVRQKRMAGQSYMNIFKMVVHASAFILTASTFPIRLASYIGVFLLPTNIIAMALGGFLEHTVNALDNCYVIYCLVFISTYIARIYKNGLNRPLFIVDWERSLINEGTTATTTLEKTA